jgi:hypothetical protein
MKAIITFHFHFILSLIFCKRSLSLSSWNYQKNGLDWSVKYPECGATNQSPIDLTDDYEILDLKKD